MENKKTLGEIRVRTDFDTNSSEVVDIIKQQTAVLIDLLESLREGENSSETHRLIATAQTKFEEASMWAVKAATL